MTDKLPWFRLYTETVDDEKIRLLAFEDRWHYVAILCCKGQGILDEENDALKLRKIAVKLGLQLRELEEVVRRLSEVGLVDQETIQPCGWCKRQYTSDNSTERVRKHREKAKSREKTSAKHDETLQKRSETVSVTPPDTDTDTEKRARATRLQLTELPDDWRQWARAQRPDLNLDMTWDCFVDYWTAKGGRDATKVDWLATWRNWVRNQKQGPVVQSAPASRKIDLRELVS